MRVQAMSDESDPQPTVLIAGGRSRGRPRVAEPRSVLSVWVWAKHHDQLIKIAKQQDRSVSSVAGEIITQALSGKRGQ